ncbi:DUF5658 family protein [Halohasta litorea]|uniref:DUF5658 family protein n=1 Tax=Halohasta litorea TaxID=869891 RepID=A0ABD6D9A3_9EURY|nr:DUF5658 family protein [Halohasta litorea]
MADRASVDTGFGRWQSTGVSGDWIRLVALAGLCLDALTTWIVLGAPGYRELNPLINGLWDGHPLLVVGYFGGFGLAVVASTCRHGRLSTAVSTYVVVVMGVFGGLNNLSLFAFGSPAPIDLVTAAVGLSGGAVIQSVIPACGLLTAAGVVRLRHGPLP